MTIDRKNRGVLKQDFWKCVKKLYSVLNRYEDKLDEKDAEIESYKRVVKAEFVKREALDETVEKLTEEIERMKNEFLKISRFVSNSNLWDAWISWRDR
jgi:hypothetical protein